MDVLEEQQEEEEEPYLQAQVEDDFQEDEGAAYVQDFQSQVDLESTGNIAPRASLTGILALCMPSQNNECARFLPVSVHPIVCLSVSVYLSLHAHSLTPKTVDHLSFRRA
jgi:hypothetical protein